MTDDYANRLVAVINAKDAEIQRLRDELASARAEVATLQMHDDAKRILAERDAKAAAFEEAAGIAENTSFMMPIDWWMQSSKKEVSVESCLQVASAIRSRAQEGRSPVENGESGDT